MSMRKYTVLSVGAIAVIGAFVGCRCPFCGSDGEAYPETVEEGFVSLFNGKDLSGWFGSQSYVVTPEGTLKCEPSIAEKNQDPDDHGYLLTEGEYRNFILRFEYKMPVNGNNGLGLRLPDAQHTGAYYGMCELQLLDDGGSDYYDSKAGKDKLHPYQYTGSCYGMVAACRDNVGRQIWGKDKNFAGGGSYARKPGMWNFEEVRVVGSEIEVWLNGYLITKADLSRFEPDGTTPDGELHPGLRNEKGHLGWMGHGYPVEWKNIRILELPDDAAMSDVCPLACGTAPEGFETYFNGCPEQLKTMWKGVTTEGKFDNPMVRAAASGAENAKMQAIADAGRDAHWSVRGGALHFDGFKGGYSLATKRDYRDFELWADWRILSVTGDSGLYLRGAPQVQIWDAHNEWHVGSGGLYNNRKHASNALEIADRQVGDWNRFHVKMVGERVTVWLNGKLVTDNVPLENYWDRSRPIFPSGQIELQCHGDPIEWRNVFIRELPDVSKVDRSRIGVCSWSWHEPMDGVAERMKEAGVGGIHLSLMPFIGSDGRHGGAEKEEAWQKIKDRVESGEWRVMSTMVAAKDEDYSTLDSIRQTGGIVPDATWEENQRIFSEGVKLTTELGCPYITLHAGFLDESDPVAFAKYVERVTWLRDEAADSDVTVLLESGQETAADLAKFMQAVPGIGINFDPANMILYAKGNPLESLRVLYPWIRQLHVKDALQTQVPGTWGTEVPWGEGEVGGAEFVSALETLGFTGNYVIEREGGAKRVKEITQAIERIAR